MNQTKRETATALLSSLFCHSTRIPIADALAEARELGVSRRTMQRACADLGVREVHNGPFGAFWERGTV